MELNELKTESLFTVSIRIIDNDYQKSALPVIREFKKKSKFPIQYLVEPQKSISFARNKGIEKSNSMIAFIDDDEFPGRDWLVNHYKILKERKISGVLGPVIPYFDNKPEAWLVKSKLCDRKSYPSGHVLHWSHTRTGNVLLTKELMNDSEARFDTNYNMGGCDVDFFKRLMNKGHTFIWCNEAPVYERVPLARQSKMYFCKRAFLQGCISLNYAFTKKNKTERAALLLKTTMAAAIYSLCLPLFRLTGTHVFMRYLVKDCHHIGRLLAMIGIRPVKNRYI